MTLDHTIPSDFIQPLPEDYEPRATRLVVPMTHVASEIWMGGVHTMLGDPVEDHHVRGSWIVDCAGELPPWLRTSALRHLPRVFNDTEAVPWNLPRLEALVAEVAEAMTSATPPERVYVMCKQGLNRSGLVSAMLLKALGMPGLEAVALLRSARPGALNNATFVQMLHE